MFSEKSLVLLRNQTEREISGIQSKIWKITNRYFDSECQQIREYSDCDRELLDCYHTEIESKYETLDSCNSLLSKFNQYPPQRIPPRNPSQLARVFRFIAPKQPRRTYRNRIGYDHIPAIVDAILEDASYLKKDCTPHPREYPAPAPHTPENTPQFQPIRLNVQNSPLERFKRSRLPLQPTPAIVDSMGCQLP